MEGWKRGSMEEGKMEEWKVGRLEGWKDGGKWSRRHSLKANEVLGSHPVIQSSSHPVIQPFLLLDQDQGSGWGLVE